MGKTSKWLKTGLVGATTLAVLAGCNANSAKDEYLDAYDATSHAKSYVVDTTLDLDVNTEGIDSFTDEEIELINSLEFDARVESDLEKEQHDIALGFGADVGAMTVHMEFPMFMDGDDMYMKAHGSTEMIGLLPMLAGVPMVLDLPEDVRDKVVRLEAEDYVTAEEQEAVEQLAKDLTTIVEDIPHDMFEKDGDMVTYTVDGDKVFGAVFDMLEKTPELFGDESIDFKDMRKGLERAVSFDTVSSTVTLDGDYIGTETITIPVTVTNPENKDETMDVAITISNTYSNYNQDVDFSFNLSEDNIMTQEELEAEIDTLLDMDMSEVEFEQEVELEELEEDTEIESEDSQE